MMKKDLFPYAVATALGGLGLVLILWGVHLSHTSAVGDDLYDRLAWTYTFQGYLIGGATLGLLGLIVLGMMKRSGRILLGICSVAFLNLAFIWSSRSPLASLASTVITPIALAMVGVGWDTGIGALIIDVYFLFAMSLAFVCVLSLSRNRMRGLLNAATLVCGLFLLLTTEVYTWDSGEFSIHFASLSPAWFTNYVLGMASGAGLAVLVPIQVYLLHRKAKLGAER